MKITRHQLRRIIKEEKSRLLREFEVPHESQAFDEDNPDFQRGYDDALSGRRRRGGQTPEYSNGFEEGVADAEHGMVEVKYIREDKSEILFEQDHEMYAEDDELRELGEAIENLSHWSMETNRLMGRMAERYGELAANTTRARGVEQEVEELVNRYDQALDDIIRFR